jgi:ATP-dependent helicase/nuclease subunit A
MRLTQAQQRAVYERGADMLVAAGAGSGKTSVLSKRIAALIAERRMDADGFIAVTFTRAAAGKLKSKYARNLPHAPKKRRARRARTAACACKKDTSMIATIDALCKRIVERYYYVCGTDPLFSIADEEETAVMQSLAAEALAEEMYETQNEAYMRLDDAYGEGYDSSLGETVIHIYNALKNKTDGTVWLEEKCAEFSLDGASFAGTDVMRLLKSNMAHSARRSAAADQRRAAPSEDDERLTYFARYARRRFR